MVEVFLNSVIILEADPVQRVHFQVFPDPITDTKAVQWADVSVVGRSEPVKIYAGSGPRQFAFLLTFFASVDADDDGTPEQVKKKVEFCQSLTYPQTTRAGIVAFPPVCILVVGNLISARVVAKQMSVKYTGPWQQGNRRTTVVDAGGPGPRIRQEVVDDRKFVDLPLMAQVQVAMDEVNIVPDDSAFVRAGRKI